MMHYTTIVNNSREQIPMISVLIDPDKMPVERVKAFIIQVEKTPITHILVGGSTVAEGVTEPLVTEIKRHTHKPVLLFPGDVNQLTPAADGLLFLSLLSGRNPEYLIGQQLASVSCLRNSTLEVMPTAYILIDGGTVTATMKVTGTLPIARENVNVIRDTAKAGELLGNKLIYLEAGSGALHPVPAGVIQAVKQDVNIPVIAGGGIRSVAALTNALNAGADMVVIGTALEEDDLFFKELAAMLKNT